VDRLRAPLNERYLVGDWLASVEGLCERLAAGVDVADVGCGAGHALVLAAAEWPRSRFVGYELDERALELARRRAAERGLGSLRFERRDATRLGLERALDVALAFDTVHDLPDPRAALAGIRRALRPGGVLVMIEAPATGDLDADTRRPGALLGYAASVGHCMQVCLAAGGQGVGNQWGRDAVLADLEAAGFAKVAPYDSPAGLTVYAATACPRLRGDPCIMGGPCPPEPDHWRCRSREDRVLGDLGVVDPEGGDRGAGQAPLRAGGGPL
jgi:SAM-dependent methyltransferase